MHEQSTGAPARTHPHSSFNAWNERSITPLVNGACADVREVRALREPRGRFHGWPVVGDDHDGPEPIVIIDTVHDERISKSSFAAASAVVSAVIMSAAEPSTTPPIPPWPARSPPPRPGQPGRVRGPARSTKPALRI